MLDQQFVYAGFWRRFIAFFIDAVIYNFLLLLAIALFGMVGWGVASVPGLLEVTAAAGILMLYLVLLLGNFVYFALFESSSWQGTPGKKLLSLKVVDIDGSKINFWRSFGRNLGKIISALIFYIGFIMAGVTKRKQALHDMFADCLVIISTDEPVQQPESPSGVVHRGDR